MFQATLGEIDVVNLGEIDVVNLERTINLSLEKLPQPELVQRI